MRGLDVTAGTHRGRGRAKATERLIRTSHEILAAIQPATVRAVCYQLFVRSLIPDMGKNATARVSRILVGARERGEIPWRWIVDESREPERIPQWSNPDSIISAAVGQYRKDYWRDQPNRVEVWSEKGTVRGTLQPVLNRYGVTLRVMHGFGSATVVNQIADASQQSDKPLIALYVGDFDPSGLFMSEVDLPDRLARYGAAVEFERVALTRRHLVGLPDFDAATKATDARHQWFVQNYGHRCWELDALSPVELRADVARAIEGLIDPGPWDRAIEVEAAEIASMREFHDEWKARMADRSGRGGAVV